MNYYDCEFDEYEHNKSIIYEHDKSIIYEPDTFLMHLYIYILMIIGYYFLYIHITFLETTIRELSINMNEVLSSKRKETGKEKEKRKGWLIRDDLSDSDDLAYEQQMADVIHSNL
jgi:hypothetical protein